MEKADKEELFSDDISDFSLSFNTFKESKSSNKDYNIPKNNIVTKENKNEKNENEIVIENYSFNKETKLSSPEIIDKELEKLQNYVIKTQNNPSLDINNNSIISISNTSQINFSHNNKRESIDNTSGLIKKLKNKDDLYIEIVVDNNNKTVNNSNEHEIAIDDNNKTVSNNNEHETAEVILLDDDINKPEISEPKRKRGRPRKKKTENPKSNEKGKQQVVQPTSKKEVSYFMELDDDDNDVIIPTAEELFDKSFHELSQKKNNKKDDTDNVKDQSPFEIIDSIFSSSDDEDVFLDKTLKIPGEGVLAYYNCDRRYHPAKILSYRKSDKKYKLRFWMGYKRDLKRSQFYTKYQPEFLTVELGEQRSEKDDVELRLFNDDELNDYIKDFIPKAQEFLKKYSWRYKIFINLELNSIKTHKELIKNSCLGYLSNTEIEYTIDQFKLALAHKTMVLNDLPVTINISEDILKKTMKEDSNQDTNNQDHDDNDNEPSSGHITRRKKKKLFTETLTESQKTNESDTIMSSLCVNEISYIDKLCRYILLPEFCIWIYMQRENKDYEESERLCKEHHQSYDWVTEILHYRETFASGRYFIKEHQKA